MHIAIAMFQALQSAKSIQKTRDDNMKENWLRISYFNLWLGRLFAQSLKKFIISISEMVKKKRL